jgi:hypothetical protein
MVSLGSVAGRIFPEFQDAGRTLDTVAAGAVILNNVLVGLDDPDLVKKASLDTDQVQELAGRIKGLGETASRLRALLDGGGPVDGAAADAHAAQIEQGLADAIARVDELAAQVGDARSRVQEIRTRLEPKLTTLAVVLTIFLAWCAVGQVGLILHGRRLWWPPAAAGS